ncbi:MAG: 50S ribosomal protein L18 [Patescibacteria group bacterium]
MTKVLQYQNKRLKRRLHGKVMGTAKRPRLSVFRSAKNIFAQIVDDEKGLTLAAVADKGLTGENKTARARLAGQELAVKALKKKVKKVVFDRSGYAYHGRVKALADGAREGGLEF